MTGKGNEAYEKLNREIGAKYGHLYQRVDPSLTAPEFKAWEEPRVNASMAEVVAAHYPTYKWDRDFSENVWICSNLECAFGSDHFSKAMEHQAEQLAANGYGKLGPTQFVLREREAELLKLKGPCSNKTCPLHYAHSGPCDRRPE